MSEEIEIPCINMIEIVSKTLDLSYTKPLILGGYITTQKSLSSILA